MSDEPIAIPRWFGRLAHDLRGPIAPLHTAIALLRDDHLLSVDRQALLDIADRQLDAALCMITELGDWIAARQHTLVNAQEVCAIGPLLDGALAALSDGSRPRVLTDPGLEQAFVHCDTARLTQLFSHLFAIFDTGGEGGAAVATVRLSDRHVTVRIPVTVPPSVEDPEQLLTTPRVSNGSGLGLGLLNAAAIAAAHGWPLTVQPVKGQAQPVIELLIDRV